MDDNGLLNHNELERIRARRDANYEHMITGAGGQRREDYSPIAVADVNKLLDHAEALQQMLDDKRSECNKLYSHLSEKHGESLMFIGDQVIVIRADPTMPPGTWKLVSE